MAALASSNRPRFLLSPPRRVGARLRREVARAALRSDRRRGRWVAEEKRTLVLGVIAAVTTGAVAAAEVGRVWRRGSAPMPSETDDIIEAAEEAVVETVEAALAGYQDVPSRENAAFNLLASFVITFASARGIAYLIRGRGRFGPFRNVIVGRRHVHHFVPGITIAFVSGAIAILTRNEDIEPKLAVPYGIGMALTLDESALLLELEDVYWTREGLLSLQVTLATSALIGALALAVRFLRRGEQIVLELEDGEGQHHHGVAAVGHSPAPPANESV
jgi:hypothetical protein